MPDTLPGQALDGEAPQTLRERQEAHERAEEMRRIRTTVTVKRTVQKVGVGYRTPKLPLILLPLIPAIASGFVIGASEPPPVSMPDATVAAVPRTIPVAPTMNGRLRAGGSNIPEAGPSNIPTLAPTSPPTLADNAMPTLAENAMPTLAENAMPTLAEAPNAGEPQGEVQAPGNATGNATATASATTGVPQTQPKPTQPARTTPPPTLAQKSNVPTLAPKSNIPTLAPTTKPTAAKTASTVQIRPIGPATVVQVMLPDGRFSQFNALLAASGLNTNLTGSGPYTVLAPRDSAFAALPEGALDALLLRANRDALVRLLKYHLVPKRLGDSTLPAGSFATLSGSKLGVASDASTTVVADTQGTFATVDLPGQPAQNGMVYGIDAVLLPPGFTFPGQVNAAGDAVLEDLTVYFASGTSVLDRAATEKLGRAAEMLAALPPGSVVSMVGHADSRGNPERNQVLSEERVKAVLAALHASLGERGAAIEFRIEHRGSTQPAENLAKSRRVTIEIQQPSTG